LKILKEEKGLTLIETVVALALLLILFAAFAGAMVVGLQSETEVDKRLAASNLASSIIEYLGDTNLEDQFRDNDDNVNYDKFYSFDTFSSEIDDNLIFDSVDKNDSGVYIDKYSDGLYSLEVTIVWYERDKRWEEKLIKLLAVD